LTKATVDYIIQYHPMAFGVASNRVRFSVSWYLKF